MRAARRLPRRTVGLTNSTPLDMGLSSPAYSKPVALSKWEGKTSVSGLEGWTSPLEIYLPGRPPSWNRAYRVANRIIYMTREAKAWKEEVTKRTEAAILMRPDFIPVDKKRIVIDIWAHLNRPMDADNLLKLTLDAVATGLHVNDRWFIPRVWELEFGNKEEHVLLVLSQEL